MSAVPAVLHPSDGPDPADWAVVLLAAERDMLAQVATGRPTPEVLAQLVAFIETHAPETLASVLLLDPEEQVLSVAAAPSLPPTFNAAVDGLRIVARAGSGGTAALRGTAVVVADSAEDQLWEGEAKAHALRHGLRSCWSTPIRATDGAIRGTIALDTRRPHTPTQRERDLVDTATSIAGIALERDAVAEAARHATIQYRTLVEHLPLVTYIDALDDISSNIFTSPQIEELLGYEPDEWRVHSDLFVRILHRDDRERVLAAHAHTHSTGEPLAIDYRLVARDGRVVWVRDTAVVVTDDSGTPLNLQGYLLDITNEKEAERELRHQAYHDQLTGLPNRGHLGDRLNAATTGGATAGLLFIDLDDFKDVNDGLGQNVGDYVLQTVAERIAASLRSGDLAARFGGDEFAVLLPRLESADAATSVAARVLSAVREAIPVAERDVQVTASIGIAIGSSPSDLLREADAAMYRAKRTGHGSYALFHTDEDGGAMNRFELINELRDALERSEFVLHYQPIVDVGTRAVSCFEALLRWRHPERGILVPSDFISEAEQTGLIVPIGRWVLQEACRQVREWELEHDRPVCVSVNVSARQLQERGFVEHVTSALEASDVAPDRLTIEITESSVIRAGHEVAERLRMLRDLGVTIALDDFGTGFSALGYLKRLPVDTVKVDRTFIGGIDVSEDDAALTRGIIELARSLGLDLIAEGVETGGQHEMLGELGCSAAQGFLYSEPVAPERAIRLLQG
jgi:diguanylate cyclase (GGDEF)-like protein/PAS domain S-box-containing protein